MEGASVRPPTSIAGSSPGVVAWLKAHPILCLALLTPGIPEYLSTSSSLLTIATNPVFFVLQLAINIGQYTAGALLIREAVLRWHKGWATVLFLSLAYGITEEGLGDNTLFNSNHGADGILGAYGHFLGVNWVWAVAVLAFHVIYSIGLPILLLGLAVPSTRGRSLLTGRGIALALGSLIAATAIEMILVYGEFHFWLGWPLLLGSLVVIAAFVLIARKIPADLLGPPREHAALGPWQVGIIGFLFFPIAFVLEYGLAPSRIPAAATIGIELVAFGLLAETVRRGIGRSGSDYLWVNLAFGFVLWQAVFGVLLTLGFPYTIPLVAAAVFFFVRLRHAYAPVGAATRVRGPPGAPPAATGPPEGDPHPRRAESPAT